MAEDQYFVYREERQFGPYTIPELRERLRRGEVETEDRCCEMGREVFYRVGDILAFEGSEEIDALPAEERLPATSAPLMGDTDPVRRDPKSLQDAPLESEEVIWRGHPTILSYGRSVFFGIGTIVAGFFAAPFWPLAPVVGLSLGLMILLFVGIERTFTLYVVTRKRVEILRGIIARSSKEVRIEDIRAINVDKEGVLGLLGIGTVEFDSAAGGDEAEVIFRFVWAAQRLKKLVRKLQDASSGSDD